MTRFAIGMSRLERTGIAVLATALALTAGTASAREADQPVAGRTPDARDVAMTPITDLNLANDSIPPVLLAAAASPYDTAGIRSCSQLTAAIGSLDSVLGPDMDIAEQHNERLSPGVVAKSVVASFIPFRGILREVTGAADHQRQFEAAIYAGAVRRGFLKGLGQQKKCAYPARPAFVRVNALPASDPAETGASGSALALNGSATASERSARRK